MYVQMNVMCRMVVHLFGGVWSPSYTSFALKTEEEAIHISNELRHLLSLGGFRLTKWVSNSRNVLLSIPQEERSKECKTLDLKNQILPSERALGLRWDVELDQFGFQLTVKDEPLTKRGLLSIVSSVFDPLGFVGPYTLRAMMILQELCRQKCGWDDPLPDKQLAEWTNWLNDLNILEQFSVNRCLKPPGFGDHITAQLHHFSDASMSGYGVATYIRFVNKHGHVHCALVTSKCRLAPLRVMTIPRLELSAAALAVKLDSVLLHEFDIHLEDSVFWTDSSLVLQYIENTVKRFHTFVANRIVAIHTCSTPTQWRYVDSKSNPGDDASRGMTAEQQIRSQLWLYGPDFLILEESQWPKRPGALVDACQIPD
jgi:hypothetical protein